MGNFEFKMDFHEQLVHFYLTAYRGLSALPQAAIRKDVNGHPWNADLDFMAVDFTKKNIYLVEVSSSANPPVKIYKRLADLNFKNIEPYVRTEILQNELSSFTLSWWFFVRSRHADKIRKESSYLKYVESGGHCEVTTLQEVLDQIKEKLG